MRKGRIPVESLNDSKASHATLFLASHFEEKSMSKN
jgi:hypothetical protein